MSLQFSTLLELRQTALDNNLPLDGQREKLVSRLIRSGVKKPSLVTDENSDLYLAAPIEIRCDNCKATKIITMPSRKFTARDVKYIYSELDLPSPKYTLKELLTILPEGTQIQFIPTVPYSFPYELPTRKNTMGCLNNDVESATITYKDENGTYCIGYESYGIMKDTGLNPYTGRPLSPKFKKLIHSTAEPSVTCSDEPPPDVELSVDAYTWLRSWMFVGVFGFQDEPYVIPIAFTKEFAKLRPCRPVLVYRGMTSKTPFELNDHYYSKILTSWTYSYELAKSYADQEPYGVIISSYIAPEDIFIDTTFLPKWVYDYLIVSDQQEVIALPGTLKLEKIELLENIPSV